MIYDSECCFFLLPLPLCISCNSILPFTMYAGHLPRSCICIGASPRRFSQRVCLKCRRLRAGYLGRHDPQEKKMATHSSILVWEIPPMEEPGRLQSTGSQKIGHVLATKHHQYICLNLILSNSCLCEEVSCYLKMMGRRFTLTVLAV